MNARPMLIALFFTIIAIVSCQSPTSTPVYHVGDTGPAGGIVFYDKGSYSSGWRYMEVAPNDIGSAPWWNGTAVATGANGLQVGTGKSNTDGIVATQGSGSYAANMAATYSLNSYSDWFLPSQDEMEDIGTNLTFKGLGNVIGTYWTSTQDALDSTQATTGAIATTQTSFTNAATNYSYLVRPIREF